MKLGNCANYYINDAVYNSNDIYTTAPGNNTNNGINGKSSSNPMLTFGGLWTAFGPFSNGDIIYVDAGTYTSSIGSTLTQNYGYAINKSISIIGVHNTKTIFDNNYCAVAGNYYFATLSGGADVKISNMQFTKYASNVDGQFFQMINSKLTLTNVLINANGGSAKYGSITVNSNSTLTMNGGGINCNGNYSSGGSGGIDVKGTNILVNVSNTSFIGNYKSNTSAIGNGAALTITAADATCNVNFNNCLFSGCFTNNNGSSGGTIYQTSGNLNITDCIIENSKTVQGTMKYGGAGYFIGGTTSFNRVKITNCKNNGGNTYGTIAVNGGNVVLESCYFENNLTDRGNDIYCKTGSIYSNNSNFISPISQSATFGGSIALKKSNSPNNIFFAGTYTCDNLPATSFVTPSTPNFTGICANGIILPITLLYFKGENQGSLNLLKWATASESNNDYFTIEKTKNGTDFEVIATINGAGNSYELNEYEAEDYQINNELNYYRLKQTDYDGKKTISDLICIDNHLHLQKKEIKYKTSMLGQKIDENYKGMILIFYTDGSCVKSYQ